MSKPIFRRALGATAAIAIVASLGACNRQAADSQMTAATTLPSLPATLPLTTGGSTAWPTAPEVAALPTTKPLRTVRVANPRDSYGYADAAYDYQNVLGDAPPDYSFDYDGVDPWAWEGYDQSIVFLEPIDQGYRYYYYRPGADAPYFVRDPDYGYGYDGDGLAVVYDRYGAVVPYNDYGASRDYAARYFVRGRDMYAASHRGQRYGVSAAVWTARQTTIFSERTSWTEIRERQPLWQQFHAQAAPRQATYWREETVRRQADTQRFDQWRAQSFRTPPPPRAIPAAWTNARWARDYTRFRPARDDRPAAVAMAPQAPVDRDQGGRFGGPGNPQPVAVTPDQRRMAIDGQRERGAPGAGPARAGREPQQPGDPRATIAPRDERRPGRDAIVSAPRPDRANSGNGSRGQPSRVERPQPQQRIDRPQPQPRFERPQPQARADRPQRIERPQPQMQADRPQRMERPQPQARIERPQPQPQVRAERPQPQPRAEPQPRPAALAQPRGNGGDDHGKHEGHK